MVNLKIVAGTGHRPQKLGGFGIVVFERLRLLCRRELEILAPGRVISGMALGFDQALALAAVDLGIKVDAYLPCHDQDRLWGPRDRSNYERMLGYIGGRVVIITPGHYTRGCMQKRNIAMVDACSQLLALWDGSKGGTFNCVSYAASVGRPWTNCWERWKYMP